MDLRAALAADSRLSVRVYRGNYASHCHAHAQVLLGLRGSLQLEVDGRPAFVDPSCGLVIPAGCSHGYRAETAAQMLVLDCEPEHGTDRLRRFALPLQWPSQWTAQCPAQRALTAHRVLQELLQAPTLQTRRRLDLALLAAQVDAALHQGWTVAQLAALCRFSPQRFRARFLELTGLPPLAWVRQRRLDEAQRQLRVGLPLDVVALRVGYASASALCFALRRDRSVGARGLRAARDTVQASLDI